MRRSRAAAEVTRNLERARTLAGELTEARDRLVALCERAGTDRQWLRARDRVLRLLLDRAYGRARDIDRALDRVSMRLPRLTPAEIADLDLHGVRQLTGDIDRRLTELHAPFRAMADLAPRPERVRELATAIERISAAPCDCHPRRGAVAATRLLRVAAVLLPPEQRGRFTEEHCANLALTRDRREWATYLVALLYATLAIARTCRRERRP